jgi:hypothetical protein
LFETDAASGNEKLIAHVMGLLPSDRTDIMSEWMLCHNHQCHHCQIGLTAVIALPLVSKLYMMCQFLSSSGHFSRLRVAANSWVGELAQYAELGQAPQRCSSFAECIVQFLDHTYQSYGRQEVRKKWWESAVQPHAPNSKACKAKADYMVHVRTLVRCWNGVGLDGFKHFCSGDLCCPHGSRSLEADLLKALHAVVLRSCPSPPASSKWTKLFPAVAHILTGAFFGIWAPLWRAAFARLPFTRAHTSKGGDRSDETIDEKLAFQQVMGKRYTAALALHDDRDAAYRFLVLAIGLEPLTYLTSFFLQSSRDVQRTGEYPYIMDALLPESSPLLTVQQYLSALLFTHPWPGNRTLLATHFQGFSTPTAFAEEAYPLYKLFRRTMLVSYKSCGCVARNFPHRNPPATSIPFHPYPTTFSAVFVLLARILF